MTFHDSSFSLAQCIRLKVGEPLGFVAGFDVADACFKSEDILDEVHDLVEMPLVGSRDVFMHEESPFLSFDKNVLSNPLGHSHISPVYIQPSFSPEY